jgi:hypothetical protein
VPQTEHTDFQTPASSAMRLKQATTSSDRGKRTDKNSSEKQERFTLYLFTLTVFLMPGNQAIFCNFSVAHLKLTAKSALGMRASCSLEYLSVF